MTPNQKERLAAQVIQIAMDRATVHELNLEAVDASEGHFRLTHSPGGKLKWAVEIWLPVSRDVYQGRIRWDPEHKGPMLTLPRLWTVLDVVDAMIAAKEECTE